MASQNCLNVRRQGIQVICIVCLIIQEVLVPQYCLIGIEIWLYTEAFQVLSGSIRFAAFDKDEILCRKTDPRNENEWCKNEGQEVYRSLADTAVLQSSAFAQFQWYLEEDIGGPPHDLFPDAPYQISHHFTDGPYHHSDRYGERRRR